MEMRNVTGKHSGLLSLLLASLYKDQEIAHGNSMGVLSSIFAVTVAHNVTTVSIGATGTYAYRHEIITMDTDTVFSAGSTVR